MDIAGTGLPVLLAGLLVKSTVVLGLALAAARASKARPAAFRHFLLSAALVGLLLLPPLTVAPVGWRSALVPAWLGPSMPSPASHVSTMSGQGRAASSANASAPQGLRTAVPLDVDHHLTGISLSFIAALSGSAADPAQPTSPLSTPPGPAGAQAGSKPSAGAAIASALVVLWIAGFAVLVLRLLVGLAGAVRLTAEGTPLHDPAWRVLVERFLALVSLRRPVRLRSHPAVLVPLTWGWRRPVVLLPDGADDWPEDERSSALFHELSHIKRADFLVMLLVRASLALFWWNPLCWIAYRELLKEQEIACDELVLRAGIRPSTYAASLLAFRRAAGFRWSPSAALLGMLGRSSFQDRLAAILKQRLTFREVQMKTKLMVALALVAAVAFIGSARPAAGREAAPERTVLAPTEIAAPAVGFELAFAEPAGQQAQTQTQAEKAKEAEKAKAAEKAKEAEKAKQAEKAIVIKPDVVEGKPIEVVITQGKEVKKLRVDKTIAITKDGGNIVLTIAGQEPQVLKGEPLRLEFKGGEVTVLKEGMPLEIDKDMHLDIAKEFVTEGGVLYVKPDKEGAQAFTVVKKGEAGKEGVHVIVESHKEGQPTIVWSAKEGEKIEPLTMAWTAKPVKGFAFVSEQNKEMLEKVRALQEQVQAIKAKKMDLSALEESLKKLEQELQEETKKLEHVSIAVAGHPVEVTEAGEPVHMTVAKKVAGEEMDHGVTYVVVDRAKDVKGEQATARVKVATGDKGVMTIVFGRDGMNKAGYEKAMANIKAQLPEGYKIVESKFDEATAAMTVKIAAPEGKPVDKDVIKKIVDGLATENKK